MKKIIVVIGAGSIGQAIAQRVSAGKHVLLADLKQENADTAAKTLSDASYEVTTTTVDVSLRNSVHALVEKATSLGEVFGVIQLLVFHLRRLRRKQFLKLICMEQL
jgi:NAD(P)-dependent dehydrogenase (short-subunit alcohol dehydrogenase family)